MGRGGKKGELGKWEKGEGGRGLGRYLDRTGGPFGGSPVEEGYVSEIVEWREEISVWREQKG